MRAALRALPATLALTVAIAGLVLVLGGIKPPAPEKLASLGAAAPLAQALVATPLGLWGGMALVVLLARAAASVAWREPQLPAYLAIGAGALVGAGYKWSNIDWLQLPFVGRVADGGVPTWEAVLPALVPLAAILLYNVWVQWAKAEEDYLRRGVAPEEARAARALVPLAMPLVAGCAALSVVFAAIFHEAATDGFADALPVVPSVLLFPVLAVAVLFGLAVLASKASPRLRRDRKAT